MSESKTSPLLEEIEADAEKAVRSKAKALLKLAIEMVTKRNEWIKARQDQNLQIEAIKSQTYEAYDRRDEAGLDKLNTELKALKSSSESNYRKQHDPFD